MGERAGYRVRVPSQPAPEFLGSKGARIKGNTSDIVRKQWYIGGDAPDLESWILEIAKTLCNGDKIGGGMCALREDLDMSRLWAAMFAVTYQAPFNSIEKDVNCDISNHGLYELVMERWNFWRLEWYPVRYIASSYKPDGKPIFYPDEIGPMKTLCFVGFEPGKTLDDGVTFAWRYLTEDEYDEPWPVPDEYGFAPTYDAWEKAGRPKMGRYEQMRS